MSILQLILGVLSLLVAATALLWQVFASDFRAWVPTITAALVARAIRKLPDDQREAQREEWIAELSQLPRRAIMTQLVWAWDLGRAARYLNATESDRSGRTLDFKTCSIRHLRSHRADLRLQAWLAADRRSVDQLLSYLACLVIYEWNKSSTTQTAKAIGCSGHAVHTGIARLEHALGETLIHADNGKKLTRLGVNIAVAARPLIASSGTSRHVPQLNNVLARQAINSIVSGCVGESWAMPLPEPFAEFGVGEQQQLRLFDPTWLPAPQPHPGHGKIWGERNSNLLPPDYAPGRRASAELELAL